MTPALASAAVAAAAFSASAYAARVDEELRETLADAIVTAGSMGAAALAAKLAMSVHGGGVKLAGVTAAALLVGLPLALHLTDRE